MIMPKPTIDLGNGLWYERRPEPAGDDWIIDLGNGLWYDVTPDYHSVTLEGIVMSANGTPWTATARLTKIQ